MGTDLLLESDLLKISQLGCNNRFESSRVLLSGGGHLACSVLSCAQLSCCESIQSCAAVVCLFIGSAELEMPVHLLFFLSHSLTTGPIIGSGAGLLRDGAHNGSGVDHGIRKHVCKQACMCVEEMSPWEVGKGKQASTVGRGGKGREGLTVDGTKCERKKNMNHQISISNLCTLAHKITKILPTKHGSANIKHLEKAA